MDAIDQLSGARRLVAQWYGVDFRVEETSFQKLITKATTVQFIGPDPRRILLDLSFGGTAGLSVAVATTEEFANNGGLAVFVNGPPIRRTWLEEFSNVGTAIWIAAPGSEDVVATARVVSLV